MEKITETQACIITAYTEILCCNFAVFHKYAENLVGHAIFTHEFADKELWAELKELVKDDFRAVCPF